MQAVILAAGLGTRLAALTSNRPKCMMEIEGRSLIARSLDCLVWAGFSETVIVTGFHADILRAHVGDRHGEMKIRYRLNAEYDVTGSMMSLLAAAPDLDSPIFAIFESDLFYHRDFARAAIEAEDNVMFTADLSGSGDEVYVAADRHGRLTYLGKQATPAQRADSPGEFAGITAMTQQFFARYRQTAHRLMGAGDRGRHYEEVIAETALEGVGYWVAARSGLAWAEVDNDSDLDRARGLVWPRLVAEDGLAPQV